MLNSKTEECVYQIVELAEITANLDYSKPLFYDCETDGLYGKLRLAQFYQEGWEQALLVEWPNPFELVAVLTKAIVVGHYVSYDISCVQENIGKLTWMPEEFHDTFLLARLHFYTKNTFSLDKVIFYCIGEDVYEDTNKAIMHKVDWSVPVLSEDQLIYAAKDVMYLPIVYNIVKYKQEDFSYRLDLLTARYCLDFQNNGLPISIDKLNARYAKNMERVKEIDLPINCNSPKQVRAYINSNLSNDIGLARLIHGGCKKAREVRETRKLVKNCSFLTKYAKNIIDGCIYGKFKVGARSGRTTCSDDNLQQMPRSLKELVEVTEDSNEVLIYSDFSQCQLRCVCAKTGDKAMETLFRRGGDLHNYVAEMTVGENFTPKDRQIAKTENFGLLFGAGTVVFSNILLKDSGILLLEEELKRLKRKWLNLWVEVKAWQTKGIKDWKKGLSWSTPLGRRYVAKMMTDQLAIQIQGFEAEVAKLAMHYMIPKLKELHPSIKLRNFVHDCYLFTCIKDEIIYKQASVIIASAMQKAWTEMCQDVKIPDLPMPVNVRVGYNWADIDKNDIFIYELNK